jgi:hypothetical protein
MVDGEVVRHFEEPGGELVGWVVAPEVVEGPDERLLRQVLGELPIPDHAVDEGEYGALEPTEKLYSGALIGPLAEFYGAAARDVARRAKVISHEQ